LAVSNTGLRRGEATKKFQSQRAEIEQQKDRPGTCSIIWKRDCHPINEGGRILREGVTAIQIDNRKLVRTGRDRGWL